MLFQEILRQHSITFETEGRYARRGWLQFQCPYCSGGQDPNRPYCGYNLTFNYVNCWRCGPHDVTKTISLLCRLDWKVAKALVGDIDAPKWSEQVHTGKLEIPKNVGPLKRLHREYLRERGFNPKKLAKLWRIEGIPYSQSLSWRIFIPIYYKGKVVSWTTRSLSDKGTRYISASEEQEDFPHKKLLYGEDYAGNSISIHEGPIDVWAVGPGAVSTMGTGFSSSQVNKMSRYARRVIAFDSEPAAQVRARKLFRLLEPFDGETINVVLDAKDAGSNPRSSELKELRKLIA